MIDTIRPTIECAVTDELLNASRIHGDRFASLSEGYGVLAEEEQEARDEGDEARIDMERLLRAIRMDDRVRMLDSCKHIKRRAILAACEWVQVAAVCKKLISQIKAEDRNHEGSV